MRIHTAVLSLLGLFVFGHTTLLHAETFSGMSYLDNGSVRIGVDLDIGGAITFLSDAKTPDENIINSHDWGRQIQMSFYSGPTPFVPDGKAPHPAWKFLGWNPIQSGDTYGNRSRVIAHTNDGTTLYVKCIPMQWPLNNEPGECTFETWVTLDDNAVKVRSRINNARSDHEQYTARGHELPALYSNGSYYRLFTYADDKPFSGGPLRRITKVWDTRIKPAEVPGGPWDNWMATEHWAALVNDDDFGVGIWTPGTLGYKGGFAGTPGEGGPKDSPTGYISPIRDEILDHNIEYAYDYTLIVGELEAIRDYVYARAQSNTMPEYVFAKDRQSWFLRDCTDAGWPIDGAWHVHLDGENPRIVGPRVFWNAADYPKVYIRAAFKTGSDRVFLRWDGFGDSPSGEVLFNAIADGVMRTYEVTLEGHKQYEGACSRLTIVPKHDGEEEHSVAIESISFHPPTEN